MNDDILFNEIEHDPKGVGYKFNDGKWKPDVTIATLLNAETQESRVPVKLGRVFEYLFRRGLWIPIQDLREDASARREIHNAARLITDLLMNPHLDEFDVHSPAFQNIIDTFVNNKVMSPLNKGEILQLGVVMRSRGDVTGIGRVQYYDVGRMRAKKEV